MKPMCVVCGRPAIQIHTKLDDVNYTDNEINDIFKNKFKGKIGIILKKEALCEFHRADQYALLKEIGEKIEVID